MLGNLRLGLMGTSMDGPYANQTSGNIWEGGSNPFGTVYSYDDSDPQRMATANAFGPGRFGRAVGSPLVTGMSWD